jgi:hypothetical protein
MWDSREFDKRFGHDTSYGAYKNQKDLDKVLYSGDDVAPYDCVTDPDFDPCVNDENVQEGFALKYRHNGDKVEIEQTWPLKPELLEKINTFLEPTAQNFLDFTKENPGILEIHYFTDLTTWEKDLEDAEDAEETK